MCGIAGFLTPSPGSREVAQTLLQGMGAALALRGPDDSGIWFDQEAGIGLSHRRLAVLDLTPAGHQPMLSACGRWVLVFNGEIYNHLELRNELESSTGTSQWRGHSDTETLLAGFAAFGIAPTLRKARGMFALALWDRKTRTLTFARDRVGEKPLYYGWQGGILLFGSELKALRAHPACQSSINRNALALYMRHNCIPAPFSIYDGIHKLNPGTILTLSLERRQGEEERYWSAIDTVLSRRTEQYEGSDEELIDRLETVLSTAIREQMVSDVPLGAFLSGGIDSTTVVALMQTLSSRPVKTFSIGFSDERLNEAEHAKAVSQHLGTDHHELYAGNGQLLEVVPKLPAIYDEPFGDSSQIPTFLVARLAREHVTVALSGDAGDELFCGYNRYVLADQLWGHMARLPKPVREFAASVVHAFPPSAWDAMARVPKLLSRRFRNVSAVGDKLHKLADVLHADDVDELYRLLISHWHDTGLVVPGSEEPATVLHANKERLLRLTPVERMMALDLVSYLPDDNLVKVDRAAMSNSLETRVPFLDPRVVEFAWSIPLATKCRRGETKWPLRRLLDRFVPRDLMERPKMGFAVPLDVWLRGPLHDWAESLLSASRLRSDGYFNADVVRERWREHISGRRNWHYQLWDVLMFQAWLELQHSARNISR